MTLPPLPPDPVPSPLIPFGARVRAAREFRGFTQDDLAAKIGLTRSSIANMESGRQDPPVTRLVHLAAALQVPVGWLFGEVSG